MAECEICGQKASLSRASIDNGIFNVCCDCAKLGKIIEQPVVKETKVIEAASKSQPEEFVVPDFSSKISCARQNRGLKQEDLAKSLNEKLSVISAIESGKRAPDLKLAKKLETFFGINLIEEA